MEKINRKILISLIITIIIIIVIIGLLLIFNKDEDEESQNEELSTVQPKEETEKIEEINELTYYNVVKVIKKFYASINKSNYMNREGNSFAESEDVKKFIYNSLSEEYIEQENITVDNVYEYVPDINKTMTFVATNMKKKKEGNISKYLVEGIQTNANDANKSEEASFFVSIDSNNNTFSIEPIKENSNKNIEISKKEIQKNENNEYQIEEQNEEEKIKEKFDNFKLLILRKNRYLYDNMINEEYRNKKFNSYEQFEEYVDKNYDRLSNMYIKKYRVDNQEKEKQYVLIDNYDKYIIINSKTPIEQNIILDTYTIDLPEFTEKYNKANESQKVGYNIERFISAINDKDYKYAYNLLDEVYRNNNMPTLEYFEEYVKRNMYDNNKVEHQGVEKQGNNFIYEIKLKDANDENSREKQMTVIMQLKEGTDFVMSFNMD